MLAITFFCFFFSSRRRHRRFDCDWSSGVCSSNLSPHNVGRPACQSTPEVTSSDWQAGLPTLCGKQVVLRELRASDAASLFALLTTEEVSRFISPPPTTVEGFERFIAWTARQRVAGTYACFAVTLRGFDTAIGIFPGRETESAFRMAEWGFAIGSTFWGTGVFQESAELVLEFAFNTVGVERL